MVEDINEGNEMEMYMQYVSKLIKSKYNQSIKKELINEYRNENIMIDCQPFQRQKTYQYTSNYPFSIIVETYLSNDNETKKDKEVLKC
jgi:hypothetical protein